MAISVASRSRRPVLRRSWNTTRKNCSISRVISCRIASTVFFSLRFCLLIERPQTADLRVGSQKLTSELLEFPEFLHFSLGFLDRRRGGQRFRDGLAIDLIGEPEIGAVTRLTGLMAVTLWLTAPPRYP
jgi:hypothetical protein